MSNTKCQSFVNVWKGLLEKIIMYNKIYTLYKKKINFEKKILS